MIYVIETEEDYQDGLRRFLELAGNQKSAEDELELNLLMKLMEKYEQDNCSAD